MYGYIHTVSGLNADFLLYKSVNFQFKLKRKYTMSITKKKTAKIAAPKLPSTIVPSDWKKATIRFSKKWKDSLTDKPGSAYYFIQLGQKDESIADFKADDGSTIPLGFSRNFIGKQEDRDKLPLLQFNGGKKMYDMLKEKMPELMVNCNPEYKDKYFMPISRFNKYVAEGNVVLSSDDMQQVANQLPS